MRCKRREVKSVCGLPVVQGSTQLTCGRIAKVHGSPNCCLPQLPFLDLWSPQLQLSRLLSCVILRRIVNLAFSIRLSDRCRPVSRLDSGSLHKIDARSSGSTCPRARRGSPARVAEPAIRPVASGWLDCGHTAPAFRWRPDEPSGKSALARNSSSRNSIADGGWGVSWPKSVISVGRQAILNLIAANCPSRSPRWCPSHLTLQPDLTARCQWPMRQAGTTPARARCPRGCALAGSSASTKHS